MSSDLLRQIAMLALIACLALINNQASYFSALFQKSLLHAIKYYGVHPRIVSIQCSIVKQRYGKRTTPRSKTAPAHGRCGVDFKLATLGDTSPLLARPPWRHGKIPYSVSQRDTPLLRSDDGQTQGKGKIK